MGFDVGKVKVGSGRAVVIAEAGVNHLGRMDYAEELIKTAARAGADIVKFQTYKASKLTTQNAPRFWSWEGEVKSAGSQFDSYTRLDSFEREQYIELIKLCNKYGVEFMSTPFDFDAADMLADIGMKGYKIASCDLNNLPFLKHIAAKGLPIMLSTGAADIAEIRKAVNVIEGERNSKLCIMHCTLCYPTDPKELQSCRAQGHRGAFPGLRSGPERPHARYPRAGGLGPLRLAGDREALHLRQDAARKRRPLALARREGACGHGAAGAHA